MADLTQKINRIANNVTNSLIEVANKGVDIPAGANSDNLPSLISEIKTGGGGTIVPVSPKAVNFRDYDGTVLYSYTAEEAAAMTELPALPTQPGLVCQGWNWSMSNVKSYVARHGKCEVGATYTTDDGKTRIYITLREGRTSPMLAFGLNGTAVVDWGDGTDPYSLTGTDIETIIYTPNHQYAHSGSYVIKIAVTGSMTFGGWGEFSATRLLSHSTGGTDTDRAYLSSITKIEIGDGFTSFREYAFENCCCLSSIVIPNSVTGIGECAFGRCPSLASVTVPDSVTTIGGLAFEACCALTSITLPDRLTTIETRAFGGCGRLASVAIPDSVASIGEQAFDSCRNLTSVTLPCSDTNIGYSVFFGCEALASVTIPDGFTTIADGFFSGCTYLISITIPDSVTSIGGNAFGWCSYLTNITIPDSVTVIGEYAFSGCIALDSVTIPDSVTSINDGAFDCTYGIKFYDFTLCTDIPTLGANVFDAVAEDFEIRVPASLSNQWKAATNWSAYADQIVGV